MINRFNFSFLSFLQVILFATMTISCSNVQDNGFIYKAQSTIAIDIDDSKDSVRIKAAHVIPTENQFKALKDEFIAFVHFGPNAFTRMEWGNGMEDPSIFNLQSLDTDQWCNTMKSAGMKKVIITAKHHDGFVLWQSRYTKHGVMSSPFKNGKGDVLKELSESCKKYGLKLGVYLSPADLYQIENKDGLYGNLSEYTKRTIPRPVAGRPFENKTTFEFEVDDYNEYFLNQLFELLTEYGPIHEVWFDGAHPKRKGGQTYKYTDWKVLIKALAPDAVVFGKEDMRWCGNESGATRKTEWNVVPYKEDPNAMNSFADITEIDVGSLDKLMKANYLHYQPAETNTSIREGWFYRDDKDQKVRNPDDVFDMYERAVGGNSIFLLNIPPNREGLFSDEDVAVLAETGLRIIETYEANLATKAEGPQELLDNNEETYLALQEQNQTVEIILSRETKVNRFMIQEDVQRHGERVSSHALDIWLKGEWKEVAKATNIGYKRILRFPEVSTTKLRLRILETRFTPVLNELGVFYYKTKPPQLQIKRDTIGMVSIGPKDNQFGWKPHGENVAANLNKGFEILFTVDGSEPTLNSARYSDPFEFNFGRVRAMAILNDELGSMVSTEFGIHKGDWKILKTDSEIEDHGAQLIFDEDSYTYWESDSKNNNPYISMDLGLEIVLKAFGYTPPTSSTGGMMQKGSIFISNNGTNWTKIDDFYFGNLINDPTKRKHTFQRPIKTRYIKIIAEEITGSSNKVMIAELDFYAE